MTLDTTPPDEISDDGDSDGTGAWSLEEAAAKLAEADAAGLGPSDDDDLDLEDELDESDEDDLMGPDGALSPSEATAPKPSAEQDADLHTVRIDGAEQGVTLEELKAGYQRQADYTRKTQSLADERRTLQSERSQYQALLQSLSQTLAAGPQGPPDQALFDSNPAEYIRQSEQWQARQQVAGAAAREQQRLHELQSLEEAEAEAAYLAREDSLLARSVPGWADPVARHNGKAELADYLVRGYGATPDDLDVFTDHRLVLLAHKAMQYDRLMSKRDLAQKKVRGVPQVQSPGAARSRQEVDAATVKALRDQFHKTGSIDDAAKLMRYLGG